mmetsp:Transcript_74278/g.204637  ORF Transcript_74278/g.204637 Transcript_74278/m.204637 type:complete len:203 (+) Transcript_74278:730-1338(+)
MPPASSIWGVWRRQPPIRSRRTLPGIAVSARASTTSARQLWHKKNPRKKMYRLAPRPHLQASVRSSVRGGVAVAAVGMASASSGAQSATLFRRRRRWASCHRRCHRIGTVRAQAAPISCPPTLPTRQGWRAAAAKPRWQGSTTPRPCLPGGRPAVAAPSGRPAVVAPRGSPAWATAGRAVVAMDAGRARVATTSAGQALATA